MQNKPTLDELAKKANSHGPVHNPQQNTIDADESVEKANEELANNKTTQKVSFLKTDSDTQ